MINVFSGRSWRWTARLVVVAACLCCGLGREAQAATTWLKVTTPQFTVVTTLSEKQARAWADNFSQFISAMRVYFPGDNRNLPPLTFVVFERDRDFRPYRPLRADGKPNDDIAGFFLREESWAIAGMTGGTPSDEVKHTIFHEGTHWFLSSVGAKRPAWFEEGLAEVFSTFAINGGRAEWGQPIYDHIALLDQYGPIPLSELLFIPQEKVFGKDDIRTVRIYGQSWMFVHYLLFGAHKVPRSSLQAYLDQHGPDKDHDPAFRAIFGKTYAEMDRELKDYVQHGSFLIGFSKMAPPPPPAIQPASALDVADALARLAYAGGNLTQASLHVSQAIAADPTDPRGYEMDAFVHLAKGEAREAWTAFENAERYGTKDYRVYTDMAKVEHEMATSDSRGGQVSPTDIRRIVDRYRKAIELSPGNRTAYNNMAALVGGLEIVKEEDSQTMIEGARLFPSDGMIMIGLAQIERRQGKVDEARARLAAVIAATAGQNSRESRYARKVEAGWRQEDTAEQLDRLRGQHKYEEALAALNAASAAAPDAAARDSYAAMGRSLQMEARRYGLDEALKDSRWEDARRLATELLQSDADAATKAQARRVQDQLDQRKLGVPKNE